MISRYQGVRQQLLALSPGGRLRSLGWEGSRQNPYGATPAAIEKVAARLVSENFYREANRQIYRATLRVRERGISIDTVTLAHELEIAGVLHTVGKGDMQAHAYLAWLPEETSTALNIEHHAQIVREKARKQGLLMFAKLAESTGYDDALTAETRWGRCCQDYGHFSHLCRLGLGWARDLLLGREFRNLRQPD